MKRIIVSIFLSLGLTVSAFAALEVAKVGSRTITDADVKEVLGNLPDAQRQQLNKEPESKARIVENIVVEEVLVQEAEKSGINKDKEFTTALERARRQLLSQRYIQKNLQPKVTDANMKTFFDSNKKRYSQDEVKASHILLATEAEAKEVLEKVNKGEDFAVLAKKHSKDPSAAQNNGDLGFFTRSRMVPEFAEAAFAADKGKVVGPIKTQFGFHIIKVIDKKEGKAVNFADVKDQVKSDFQSDTYKGLIEGLKKSKNVSINAGNVKEIKF
jgi:peptidyl-prolyl cis-trans isomerase C